MRAVDPQIRLEGLEGDDLKHFCATHVERARDAVYRRAVESEFSRPNELLRELAADFDRLLRALFAKAVAGRAQLSLIALGGYGRRQLYPYSDVDLLLIPGADVDVEGDLVNQALTGVIYPLWDARVSVGHAVRTIESTLDLAHSDLTMRTSLLDARLIAGDEGLFFALEAGAYREFFGAERVNDFVAALVEEREKRHPRFGDTVYLLEPNIKSGSGGLRDLNTSLWAAKARFGISGLSEVSAVGAATGRQQAALVEARDFLSGLRMAMHLQASRAQDRLLFEVQEALAPQLFPDDPIPGGGEPEELETASALVAPAVERLMHAYYRSARTVVLETEGILQRCAVRPTGEAQAAPRRLIEDHFWAEGDAMFTESPARFWDKPSELVRAFAIAARNGLRMQRGLKDVIAEAAAGKPGLQLRADQRGTDLWRQLLCEKEDPDRRLLLERMHDVGVLNAIVPEFEPCTGLVQHDLYHVYTVDRHSLYVVGMLKALRRGDLIDDHPMASDVISELEEVEILYLAALLHDVAKPLGKGHSIKGARLAAGVAARLGLDPEQQREVVFLVRQHLTMPHLSQRRDLADPAVIESLAQLVQDVDRLRCLYLLSVADTAMTAPGNLTSWKASLLEQLFAATFRRLTSGVAALPPEALRGRRRELGELLRETWGDEGPRFVNRLPDDLVAGHSPEGLAHHVGVALDLQHSPESHLRIGTRRSNPTTTVLTVCCEDAPGLLATITGALVLHRVEVLSAQVYTIGAEGGARGSWALDIFWVSTADPADFRSWHAFFETLERALTDEQHLSDAIARRLRPSGIPTRVLPRVRTDVFIDNDGSERSTIIELHSADVAGLLHTVTHELTKLGLVIDLAKVATQASQVSDVFYVRDRESGLKVTDPRQVERVRGVLSAAVNTLARGASRRATITGPLRTVGG